MKYADIAIKLLSLLVIPLLLWGVKLAVKNAVQDAEIVTLRTDLTREVSRLDNDISEAKSLSTSVQNNSVSLARLEAKLDAIDGRTETILSLVRQ